MSEPESPLISHATPEQVFGALPQPKGNLGIRVESKLIKTNQFRDSAHIAAYDDVMKVIGENAPLLVEKIHERAPVGSNLQNMISDFEVNIKEHSPQTSRHVRGVVVLTAKCANHLVNEGFITAEEGADLCVQSP